MYPDSGIHETIFNVYSSPSSFGVCNEFMFLESCIDDALPIRILFLKYVFLGVLLTKKVWNLLEDPKYILSKLIESKYLKITNLLSILINKEPVIFYGSGVYINGLLEIIEPFNFDLYLTPENASIVTDKRDFDRVDLLRFHFE